MPKKVLPPENKYSVNYVSDNYCVIPALYLLSDNDVTIVRCRFNPYLPMTLLGDRLSLVKVLMLLNC